MTDEPRPVQSVRVFRSWILGAWALTLTAAGLVLPLKLEFSYDLGLFLPAARSPDQQVLLERLGEAPGTRYIMIGVPARTDDGVLQDLADTLADQPVFSRVLTDTTATEIEAIPDPLWRYRYLLTDVDLGAEGLARAFKQRVAELSLFGGAPYNTMLAADPGFAALGLVERLGGTAQAEWITADGTRLLVAETVAPAFDLGAQQQAVDAVQRAIAEAGLEAEVSGVGTFGVGLRETIHHEATQRSILASVALAAVLLLAYRRFSPLWIGAVPLLSGMLLGLAAIALLFGRVHGITLAFGFTLLGIAIDYPLHLLSHARGRPADQAVASVWPTLRLGAVSTMLAYLAIAVSGSEGLAQLGVFTLIGVAVAAVTTRWVLPRLLPDVVHQDEPEPARAPGMRWWHLPLMVGVCLGGAWSQWPGQVWNDDLSALSPIPRQALLRDGELRQALGAPDLRQVVVVRGTELQNVLDRTQAVQQSLPGAVDAGWLVDYRSVADLLPSTALQELRRERLPPAGVLRQSLDTALSGKPFAPEAFAPFLAAVEGSRSLPPLGPADYENTPFAGLLGQHLYRSGPEWVSLIALYEPDAGGALAEWLSTRHPDAHLVNLHQASVSLVQDYRQRTLTMLGLALLVILVLLLWRIRMRRALWALVTVGSAIVATGALVHALAGPLNLYHLMALLLVGGLGLDYALFLSRPAGPRDMRDSRHAVWACAASTLAAFGVLGLSDIPALHAMGMTVATGTAFSVIAARLGTST